MDQTGELRIKDPGFRRLARCFENCCVPVRSQLVILDPKSEMNLQQFADIGLRVSYLILFASSLRHSYSS